MLQRLNYLALVLVGISILFFGIGSLEVDKPTIANDIIHELENYIERDSAAIVRYFNTDFDKSALSETEKIPLNVEIVRGDSTVFWNVSAQKAQADSDGEIELVTVGDSLNRGIVKLDFQVYNSTLKNKNVRLTSKGEDGFITINGQKIGISILTMCKATWARVAAWWVFFFSFLLFTTYLCKVIKEDITSPKLVRSHLFQLFVVVLGFKGMHYLPQFLDYFGEYVPVSFDNMSFSMTPGPAHLLINLWIFGLSVYLFHLFLPKLKSKLTSHSLLLTISGLYTFVSFGMAASLIEGFVLSPQTNLEIESLMEFNVLSFGLMVCFIIMMLLIFQSTQLLYEWINEREIAPTQKLLYSFIGWSIGLAGLSLLGLLHLPIWIFVLFIAAYTLILDAYTENKERKITYLIWWLIMFAGYLAVILFYFGLKKDIVERTAFLQSYYVKSDDKVVNAMITLQDSLLARDVFRKIASLELSEKLDQKDLHQFMVEGLTNPAMDSFDIAIELFDKNTGNTIFSNHFSDYNKLKLSYENARKVGRAVFHNPFEDRYIIRFEIARPFPANASWYLFIIYENKRQKALYNLEIPKYGYAVFSNNNLIIKADNNQAAPDLTMLKSVLDNTITSGYSYVLSFPSDQYKIVSWKQVSGLIKPISLFSFIFTLCGILILILALINTRYDFLPENISLKFGSRSSLKTKIQLAIIVLILVTFLIIGTITGMYFKNLIEANQNIKHKEETISIANNIRSDIQNFADDEYARNFLSSKLKDLSYIHDKDLSLYDQNGYLISSTTTSGANMRIPYQLWLASSSKNNSQKIYPIVNTKEYLPIYLNESYPFAYIGIDHKAFNASSGNILDFLSTILNAYIFLFLIAGGIAITIANSITQPLTILAEKLKKFKLGKSNEQLEWKSNDEIGTLIHDYNNLTHELERSAGLLAKTERDMAWREMAKQVAHEIKNPLTPMKLSIQYLDKTAKDYPDKAQELIPRISSTLIEQIDNLSQIANEFSNFASMPQASNEKIILNEIVETIHDLFRKRDDMDINMIEPIDDLYVFADKNHLVRILNNLLKNAIQAIPDNKRGRIEIELNRNGNDAVIRISDNGTGIPDYMKDKVFTPNFTTKSSGTGLGLAISANMIESFNGKIYFETNLGKGTDFFVSIPLMRLDDYFPSESRVSLD